MIDGREACSFSEVIPCFFYFPNLSPRVLGGCVRGMENHRRGLPERCYLGEICGKKVFSLRFLYSEWIYVETGIRYNRSEK